MNPKYQNTYHSYIFGLDNDDHQQYVHLSNNRIITGLHTFSGIGPAFAIVGTSYNSLISGLNSFQLQGYIPSDFALVSHTHSTGQINSFTTGVWDAVNPWITGKFSGGNGISVTNLGSTLQFSISGLNNLLPTGYSATLIGNGTVDNTEFGYLDGVTSSIQTQLNSKLSSNQLITLSGDVSATGQTTLPVTLATINSTTGTFSNPVITVNSKGLITSVSSGPALAPTGVAYLTLTADATLTNERILTAGTGINFTDNGANSSLIITIQPTGINHSLLNNLSNDDHTQYLTTSRALTWLGTRSTSDLPEGTNLYSTPTRIRNEITGIISRGNGIQVSGTNNQWVISVSGLDDYLLPTGINATKIGLGTVDNTKFDYLSTLTSNVQTQLNAKGVGSVTNVSAVNASGVVINITNPTSTPSFEIGLQRITPTSLVASQHVSGINLIGTNTGDQLITLSGDIAGTGNTTIPVTLPNINSNVGTFSYATITVNAKGQVTAASSNSASVIYAPTGSAYLTIGNDSNLASERAITAGTAINFTDGGAGSTFTINVQPTGIDHDLLKNLIASDSHTQYISTSPTSTTRNFIQPGFDIVTALKIQSCNTDVVISGSGDFISFIKNDNSPVFKISATDEIPDKIRAYVPFEMFSNNDIRFFNGSGSNYIALAAPTTIPLTYSMKLPQTTGLTNQVLTYNAGGQLTWSTVAPISPSYLTLATDSNLTSERVLTAGTGINLTDSGAGGILRINVQATGIDHNSLQNLATGDVHTQYHTDARALTWLGTRSTTDLPEGNNLYYSATRARNEVTGLLAAGSGLTFIYNGTTSLTIHNTGLEYTDTQAKNAVGGILSNTSTLNLYYTADTAISGQVIEENLNINNSTGVLSIARGGTNATTANIALNNILPIQTTGGILYSDGTNTSFKRILTQYGFNLEGYPISTGTKGYMLIEDSCIINQCLVFTNATGSLQVDVLKSTSGTYPTFTSVTNNSYITLSNEQAKNHSISAWTTGLSKNDLIQFQVYNCSGINQLNIFLTAEKT